MQGFFANLNSRAAFFSKSPKRTQLLDDMCKRRLPRVAPTWWQCTSRLVNAVHEKRVAQKEVFDHILEHHDEDTVLCADGFNTHLDDSEFCFCSTYSMGFLSMLMCSLECYRRKHLI